MEKMEEKDNMNKFTSEKKFSNNKNIIQVSKEDFLDGDLVSLINALIKSLKEYYQVSSGNDSDANNLFLYYKEEQQNIQLLLNNIIINNQYEKINEVFEKFNSLGEIISQLQENSKSNLQNLKLFFEDAKIIFKNIQVKRYKQLKEHSKAKSFHDLNKFKMHSFSSDYKTQVDKLYNQLTTLMNKLSDFDYIIEKTNSDSAVYFNNLKNSIKNILGELINYVLQIEEKSNLQSSQYSSTLAEESLGTKTKSTYDLNQEIEKFKMSNILKDKRIRDLTSEIQKMKKKYNSNVDFYDFNNSEINTNKNIQNILSEKNNIISNLQKQINVYEQNEAILNKQLDDLNNQFQFKINQYENQIKILKIKLSTNINTTKNKLFINNINKSNTEQKNKNNKNIDKIYSSTEHNMSLTTPNDAENLKYKYNSNMNILKNKNMNLIKQIKAQKIIIDNLNKEKESYKNKLDEIDKMNKYQIEEMSNNIFKTNKIIEQKDELIKQLREKLEQPNAQININMGNHTNNNEILLIKLENEKLKKEISLLKKNNNNNLSEDNNISSLKAKNSELEENIDLLRSKIEQQEKIINNLELEISKKKEQIEGMNDFIAKLQAKIENSDITVQKKESRKFPKSEVDINKDSEISEKMKNLLDLLNNANKDIATLQKKNKELQFKLDDKELEEDLSGFRTEEVNFSNYEEEFDLRKMINGAKVKNKSEDIYIDYPGVQNIKNKYKCLQTKMVMLEEQIKILLCNINCNSGKIKPQINQICQIMRIPAKNIQLIFAGKNKKKILGLID